MQLGIFINTVVFFSGMLNRMVMTRAPLRITFVGGGTDLPFYYENRDYGAVVSSAINKYIYVTATLKGWVN